MDRRLIRGNPTHARIPENQNAFKIFNLLNMAQTQRCAIVRPDRRLANRTARAIASGDPHSLRMAATRMRNSRTAAS
jgi:hypothetical protein